MKYDTSEFINILNNNNNIILYTYIICMINQVRYDNRRNIVGCSKNDVSITPLQNYNEYIYIYTNKSL